jgi:hypothetical protein
MTIQFFMNYFVIQLVIGDLMFAVPFRKKAHFIARFLISLTIILPLSYLIFWFCYQSSYWVIRNTLCYMLTFVLSQIFLFVCYEEPSYSLILCAVSGYMVQHIASQICQMPLSTAWEFVSGASPMQLLQYTLLQIVVFTIVYALIYVLFARNTVKLESTGIVKRNLMILSVTTVIIVSILSSARDAYSGESQTLMIITRLFSIFCCIFLLFLRSGILEKGEMEQENEALQRLYILGQKQYEQSKENIELINIKCHDMKHQIEQWEHRDAAVDHREIREIKEMIGIYDSTIRTGNETLDTILTERSIYCEKHGIRLSCMIDGSKLSFMPVGDICSLFGNALENSIEAVSDLEEEQDRIISVLVREKVGMLVITVDNYYTGSITMKGDLPETTKGDRGYHGYGMKSIRMIAEKYGGEATIIVDDMFHLSILLPIPSYA